MPETPAHPPRDQLAAFTRGQLSGPESDEIEAHLHQCKSCSALLDHFSEDGFLAALRGAARPAPECVPTVPAGQPLSHATDDTPAVWLAAGTLPADPAPMSGELPGNPQYRLVGLLGRGGMGVVYRAEEASVGREVAVKVLRDCYRGEPAAGRRFLAEAGVTARLQHPGIPPVFQVGTLSDGSPFLAMKLIAGRTLAELLAGPDRPNTAELVSAFEHVCHAVGYAHSRGVVHRDLKPANVMVGAFGEVQVMDWGLAKDEGRRLKDELKTGDSSCSDSSFIPPPSSLSTRPGAVMGTPAYMAPEQARGEVDRVGRRSDVFGLGAILCEILTGAPPFAGADSATVLRLAAAGAVELALARLGACPEDPALVALCKRCLAANPAERPADAAEVAGAVADLRAAASERARRAELDRVKAHTEARAVRKRRRVQFALAVSVCLLGAGAGAGAWWQDKQRGERDAERRVTAAANREGAARALDLAEAALRKANPVYGEIDAALNQAEQRVDAGGADDLMNRLRAARAARRMLERLDRIADQLWTVTEGKSAFDGVGAREGYRTAFREYGLDLLAEAPQALAEKLRGSVIAVPLQEALDAWLVIDDDQKLVDLLAVLDPDPARTAVRRAVGKWDRAALAAHTDAVNGRTLPPSFAVLVTHPLNPSDRRLELLKQAQAAHPSHFGLAMWATVAFAETARDASATYCRIAVAIRPANPVAHANLAHLLATLNELAGAEEAAREAIRLDPRFALAHVNLGAALQFKGDLAGAEAAIREAIRLDPTFVHARANLGSVLYGRKDAAGAAAAAREAIKLDPTSAFAHDILGAALGADEDPVGAEAAFRVALRLDPKYATAHSNLGALLHVGGNLTGAEESYREAIRLDPKLEIAHSNLGDILRVKGDLAGAEAAIREAIRLDPTCALAHDRLGKVLHTRGDVVGAEAKHREALRLDPTCAPAHDHLGVVLHGKGDHAGAEAEYRLAIKLQPKNPTAHFNLGVLRRDKGDAIGAEAAFREAIKLDPKYAAAHLNLGNVLLDKRDTAGAEAAYREATKHAPQLAVAHSNLGNVLHQKGDLTGAETALRLAIELDPKYASVHLNLGRLLHQKGNAVGAEAEYRLAIKFDAKLASAHDHLGLVLHDRGDFDGAEAEYLEAIKCDPKLAIAHTKLGNVLHQKGELAGAEASHRLAIKHDPKLPHARTNLGNVLHQKGELTDAEAAYREAIKLDPKFVQAHVGLGMVLTRKGDAAGAIPSLKEAVRLAPNVAPVHYYLGTAQVATGDPGAAVKSFREVVRLDPRNAGGHHVLGLTLAMTGDLTTAISELELTLRLDPKSPTGREDLRRVQRYQELRTLSSEFAAGRTEPKSTAAALELAEFCREPSERRYALATRLYTRVISPDVVLVAVSTNSHRYHAARAAALVAAGKDADLPAPGAEEVNRFTGLAYQWLRAELDVTAVRAGNPKGSFGVRAELTRWKEDKNLASVRDAAALAAMPEPDRKRWNALWAEVDSLIAPTPTAPPPRAK